MSLDTNRIAPRCTRWAKIQFENFYK